MPPIKLQCILSPVALKYSMSERDSENRVSAKIIDGHEAAGEFDLKLEVRCPEDFFNLITFDVVI